MDSPHLLRSLLGLALLSFFSGCALPIQVAAGATLEVPYSKEPVHVVPELRAGVNPLGVDPLLFDRKADVSTGIIVHIEKPLTKQVYPRSEIYLGASAINRHEVHAFNSVGTLDYTQETLGVNATFWPGKEARVGSEVIAQEQALLNCNGHDSKNFCYGEASAGLYASFAFDTRKFTATVGLSLQAPLAGSVDFPTTDAW